MMKKKFVKIMAFVCCLVFALSFAACSRTQSETGGGASDLPEARNTQTDYTEHKVEGTLHKGLDEIPDSGIPFVVNGATEYKLAYNAEDEHIARAARYIATQIGAATGAYLETETSPVWSETAKYVVVGDETLRASAGVAMTTEDIGNTGYQIVTKGNSVFISANGGDGYHLGALAFLRITVGYEALAADAIYYTKDGSYLPAMNVVERPDFDFRYDQVYWSHSMEKYYAMGQNVNGGLLIDTSNEKWKNTSHNSFYFLPPEDYEEEHPDWYSAARCDLANDDPVHYQKYAAQICYTGHGKSEEKAAMQKIVADEIVRLALLDKNANKSVINFTQQDESVRCECDACNAIVEEYGNISAAVIMFANGVDDLVQQKLREYAQANNTPVKELYIRIYAYQLTRFPPEKVTDEVLCNEHVNIWLAASKSRFSYTFYDDINLLDAQAIRDWSKFGKIHFWFYNLNAMTYFIPQNTFSSTVENMRFAKENGGIWMGNNGVWLGPKITGFTTFKEYLDSRLEFNVNYNFSDLKETFFAHYYGDAGRYMEQFFDEVIAHEIYLRDGTDSTDFNGVVVNELSDQAKYWPKALAQRWADLCEQALKAIEKTKLDGDGTYETLRDRIVLESLFPRYVLCELQTGTFSAAELQEMRQAFYDDCTSFSMVYYSDYKTLEPMWRSWNVA